MIPLRDDNPTEITPVVTVAFIVSCVLVFLYEVSLSMPSNEAFVYMYGAIPAVVLGLLNYHTSWSICLPMERFSQVCFSMGAGCI